MNKGPLGSIAWVLLIIGGLNWGLVGIGGFLGSDWNVVKMILGSWPTVESLIYLLVGLSALVVLIGKKNGSTSGMAM